MFSLPINLAVEDALSEAALRRLLSDQRRMVGYVFGRRGNGYLRNKIRGWNQAARGTPLIVLTDLDNAPCPRHLIGQWMGEHTVHPNLLLRVAVKEVEAWLLADWEGYCRFIRLPSLRSMPDIEALADPKRFLLDLTSQGRNREVNKRLLPRPSSDAHVGPEYNSCLSEFVLEKWNWKLPSTNAPSLRRLLVRLDRFHPVGS